MQSNCKLLTRIGNQYSKLPTETNEPTLLNPKYLKCSIIKNLLKNANFFANSFWVCHIFVIWKPMFQKYSKKRFTKLLFHKANIFLISKRWYIFVISITLSIPYVYYSCTTYNGLRGHEKYNYYIFHLFLLFCYSRQQMKESVSMGQIDTTKGMYLYVVSTTTFLSSWGCRMRPQPPYFMSGNI